VNEPVGVLRLADPFRIGDASVSLAPPGYRVIVEQVSWPPRAWDVARIAATAAREGTRIVHAHGRSANLVAVPAARLVRAKAICTRGAAASLAETLALRAADAVMCSSWKERDRCVRRERIPAAKVCVVYPGVDLARFGARAPDSRPLVVAVGGLFARNGHLDFLDAVARVRLTVSDLRVICAGEGPLRPVLEQRIAHLGLRDTVQLPGHLPDVPALLARAHAAWTQGLRATVEAMAAGVPVASPWRELIGADLAVPRLDPAALAERLLALLRDQKVGAALRKRAENGFSLDAFGSRLGALYGALLAPAERRAG
jgi:glycosyltransferase involved in cell wall biosynthesis